MTKEAKTRMERCMFCRPYIDTDKHGQVIVKHYCGHDCHDADRNTDLTKQDCEKCNHFDSKYIEYPIMVSKINNQDGPKLQNTKPGTLCEIRKADSEQTYIGIYVGEFPYMISTSYDNRTQILQNTMVQNPAIFVPELERTLFGYESWWRPMEKTLHDITDDDIKNQPYLQMLTAMLKKQENPS